MKLQTKCTWVIVGLFIVEILPVPVTSLYSLYAVRKRPAWLPVVTHNLYAEKQDHAQTADTVLLTHDPMLVRKNCTKGLVFMFIIDLLVPVVIPTALYVVRKRPLWFKDLIVRLYADQPKHLALHSPKNAELHAHDPFILARTEQKIAALEQKNFHFAKKHTRKHH